MTEALGAFVMSGRVIDVVLVVIAIEAALLAYFRIRHRLGSPVVRMCANLASGASLMIAIRLALTDAHWGLIMLCLMVSFIAHLTDIKLGLRRDSTAASRS